VLARHRSVLFFAASLLVIIREKKVSGESMSLKFVDDRLLTTPPVALMQVKKEMDYMVALVEENIGLAFTAIDSGSSEYAGRIRKNEEIIDFTNSALNKFLIRLSVNVEQSDERIIGSYFHVLNDLERIGDHAENFHEIGVEMIAKKLSFSEKARGEITDMRESMMQAFEISKDVFKNHSKHRLPELAALEEGIDTMKKTLIASYFARLAEGNCNVDVSPYYTSLVSGLERVADHLVNVGFSITNPIGSQRESHLL